MTAINKFDKFDTGQKPKLLTVTQAAKLIDGLTPFRLKRLLLDKKINCYSFGKKLMVTEKSVLDYFGFYEDLP